MSEWIVATLVGVMGGFFDSLLGRYKGFVMPKMLTGSDGRRVLDPGFVGNLAIGAGAGFIAWALSANAAFSDKSLDVGPILAALLAGAGGSEVLAGYVRRKQLEDANEQTENTLDTTVKREERLREELQGKDETIKELYERVKRLEEKNR